MSAYLCARVTFNSVLFTVVDEVWHQQAVFRLLQLVELPLLENLLEGKDTCRPPLHAVDSDPDLLYTSSYLDREVLKAFSEAQYVLKRDPYCYDLSGLRSCKKKILFQLLHKETDNDKMK